MYTLYCENDPDMIELCSLFCEAKSPVWRMFFGWRKTTRHGAYFKLTRKQHARILKSAEILVGYRIL